MSTLPGSVGTVPKQRRRSINAASVLALLCVAATILVISSTRGALQILSVAIGTPGCRQKAHGPGSRASDAELQAGLRRQQCPVVADGSNVTIAFLHVPKTAGTFLMKLMADSMPATGSGRYCIKRQDYSNHANFPCLARTGLAPEHHRLLSDVRTNLSTVCSGMNFHQDWGFFVAAGIDHSKHLAMVALRHPVERGLSHYYFQMQLRKNKPDSFPYWPKNDSDFSGLLAFGSEQRQQANYHTYLLAGAMGCQWPGGPVPPTSDAEILERAKRNLETFCVVLIVEFMEESLQLLGEAAGWPASARYEPDNSTPRPRVPLWVRRELELANYLDMELYEYAVRLFLRRSNQAAVRQAAAALDKRR